MIPILLVLMLAFPQAQDRPALTAQNIIEAYRQGISVPALLATIDSAAKVAPATEADLAAMRQAGVPAEVIERYQARSAGQAAQVPQNVASGPEDPRLKDVVRLVKAGLSEDLVINQILFSGEVYRPSVSDLLYLKDNQVPESVIRALLQTKDKAEVAKNGPEAKTLSEPKTFLSLIQMKGFMKKNAPGTLTLKEGQLEWVDGKNLEKNFQLQLSAIRMVWLECSPRAQGNFCYEINLETFNGDNFRFRDASWKTGVNTQISALYDTLKTYYPQIIFQEKVN